MSGKGNTTVLVPLDLDEFFERMRVAIREEVQALLSEKDSLRPSTPGLTYRPLYDMQAVRHLFRDVSRSTICEWIKAGKLKRHKINGKGKVYFLWTDIERLWNERTASTLV